MHIGVLLKRLKAGKPPKEFVICAAIFLNVCFGFYPVVVKTFANGKGEKANPYIFTFYRDLGAVPTLFLLSYLLEGALPLPNITATMYFMLFGLFGMFLGQFSYINGLYLVGPDMTSAIQPLIAIWTPIISTLLCVEKVPSWTMSHTYIKLAGILTAVGGAAKLIFSGLNTEDTNQGDVNQVSKDLQAFGYISLLFETFCGGMYFTMQKKLVYLNQKCMWKDYPIAMTAYSYLFGATYMGLATLYYVFTGQYDLFWIPQRSLPALVYAVFITSTFCYFTMTWCNKHIPSSLMTAFWPVQVIVTATGAYLLFEDELTSGQCLGAVLIFIGLALVIYSSSVDDRLAKENEAVG